MHLRFYNGFMIVDLLQNYDNFHSIIASYAKWNIIFSFVKWDINITINM